MFYQLAPGIIFIFLLAYCYYLRKTAISVRGLGIIYFPNRSLLLRVLMEVQRGGTETHTKREAVRVAGRPAVAVAVLKFIEDSH